MNAYIERVIEQVKKRDAHEPEFIQTVEEVFSSIEKEVEQHPEYEKWVCWKDWLNLKDRSLSE